MRIEYKPNSYEVELGKWVPSGTIVYGDDDSVAEIKESFKGLLGESKEEADQYFIMESKKKFGAKADR